MKINIDDFREAMQRGSTSLGPDSQGAVDYLNTLIEQRLAKHMPQVTAEDIAIEHEKESDTYVADWPGWKNIAKRLNARLRSRLVPEAAVEWDEWHVPAFGERLDENCERRHEHGKVMIRRKKQAQLPTQEQTTAWAKQVLVSQQAESPTQDEQVRFEHPTAYKQPVSAASEVAGSPALESPHQPPQVAGDGAEEVFAHVVRVANEALAKDCAELQQKNQGLEQDANALREQLNTANQLYQIAVNEREELREQVETLDRTTNEAITEWREVNSQLTTAQKERDEALFDKEQAINRQAEQMARAQELQAKLSKTDNLLIDSARGNTVKDAEIVRLKEELVRTYDERKQAIHERDISRSAGEVRDKEIARLLKEISMLRDRSAEKSVEIDRLNTTLRTAPAKGLTVDDLTKTRRKCDNVYGYVWDTEMAKLLNAILSAQPVETHMKQEPQPAGQSVNEAWQKHMRDCYPATQPMDRWHFEEGYRLGATSQQQAREKLEAWKSEIQGAIQRSGMGIMRTSQGPVGTMIAYTEKNEKRHQDKMLELIHENIDLGQQVKMDTECIERIRAAAVRDKFRADEAEAKVVELEKHANASAIQFGGIVKELNTDRAALRAAVKTLQETIQYALGTITRAEYPQDHDRLKAALESTKEFSS